MKSKHLAKADFVRRLSELASELYELGDFTSTDPKRELMLAKIQGFAEAGTTIQVIDANEVQRVIDKVHLAKFGEEREVRKTRILEERAGKLSESADDQAVDWGVYDSPAKDRKKQEFGIGL